MPNAEALVHFAIILSNPHSHEASIYAILIRQGYEETSYGRKDFDAEIGTGFFARLPVF